MADQELYDAMQEAFAEDAETEGYRIVGTLPEPPIVLIDHPVYGFLTGTTVQRDESSDESTSTVTFDFIPDEASEQKIREAGWAALRGLGWL